MRSTSIFNSLPCTGTNDTLSGEQLEILDRFLAGSRERGLPILPAFHKPINRMVKDRDGNLMPHPGVWCVWCEDCDSWHEHGPALGERMSHCFNPRSRHFLKQYIIAYAGEWRDCFKRRKRAMRRFCPGCADPHPCRRAIPLEDTEE